MVVEKLAEWDREMLNRGKTLEITINAYFLGNDNFPEGKSLTISFN